jgi:hypothetical protein
MDGARYSGRLSWWSDTDNGGFGHITPDHSSHGTEIVYREELLKAGIRNPVVGIALTYQHGITRGGISSAVAIQAARDDAGPKR